jgi:hypothetical protein
MSDLEYKICQNVRLLKNSLRRRAKMSEKQPDCAIQIVEFLKALGTNPDRKVEDIARDVL